MEPTAVFVYGTLQRGEERAARWPRQPARIERATITGRLHDLGPYPALVPGPDLILGELWHFEPRDIEQTLEVLDAIECYGVDDVDLYVRRVVTATTMEGTKYRAFTYFYADPQQIPPASTVLADPRGYCHWRRHRADCPELDET